MESCRHKSIPFLEEAFMSKPFCLFLVLWLSVGFGADGFGADRVSPRAAWTSSKIQGLPTPPEPYQIVSAFPHLKFQLPSSLVEMPNGQLLVTEIGGKIFSFPNQNDVKTPHLIGNLSASFSDEGGSTRRLFHVALHPKFSQNRYLFACYVHPGTGTPMGKHTRVSRFTLTKGDKPRIEPNNEVVLITWKAGGHNGGCLQFGNDGMLYISTGDGSGPNPPDGLTTGQDLSDLLGAVLRIDVDHQEKDRYYRIPKDNPFVKTPKARGEIWAYGLRNPWKFGIDPKTGAIFAADNGWETWESVHKIVRGGNCGWPVMEGRAILRSEVKPGPTPIRPPIKDHLHTEANSVIGGPVYRGKKLPGLEGAFIYGDYITGTIWSVQTDDNEAYHHQTLVDTDQRIVAFTQTKAGSLYVLDYDFTGQIFEIVPTTRKDTSEKFPRKLSETGLFTSLKTLTPADGVVPYAVKVPRWMDGASTQKFVAIPNREVVQLSQGIDQPARYPDGTVFVNHVSFSNPDTGKTLPIETQILHYEYGQWQPYSYLWNADGTEAELVESIGTDRALELPPAHPQTKASERTWHINAQNECKLCHNAASGFVLGFVPNQLDRPSRSDPNINQLEMLKAQGVVAAVPSPESFAALKLVDHTLETEKLNDRARSYLHVNCSMCHHPGGTAIISFYLRRDMPFEKLNTNKGTGIGTFGMQDAKLIVPGDPYRSVLMYRMSKLGYARMPYIGSRVVDSFGVALIEDWITSLPTQPGQKLSPPLQANSPAAKALQTLMNKKSSAQTLVKTTEGALALTGELHRGRLEASAFQAAVSIGNEAKSDVRGLFETFIPEAQRRATLGPNIQPETILDVEGNPERGKLIFFSDSARCRNCHDLSNKEKSIGPTLMDIRKKYPRRSEMLSHILKPSLKIEEVYTSYIALTTAGQVHTGMMVKQEANAVTLKTAEKKLITIPKKEIEVLKKSTTSLMPDRILSDLTAQEAADLLSYLLSLEVKH